MRRDDEADLGGDGGQQDAVQPVLLGPVDVLDRVVDVVQEDLADAGALVGLGRAEVDEPPVVGLDPGAPVRVVLGRGDEARLAVDGARAGERDLPQGAMGGHSLEVHFRSRARTSFAACFASF